MRNVVTVSFVFVLAACQPSISELSPLPQLQTQALLPVVAAQFEAAHNAIIDDPRDAAKNGDYALALHAYDHSESAFILYERARQLSPKDPRWPYYQSAVSQRLGDLEGSLSALDDALALNPDHIDIMAKRGEALFLLSRLDEAEAQLQAVLARNPDYPLANFYVARIKMERQEWQQAVSALEDLLQRGLDVREVHQNLGTVYRVLGRSEESRVHLNLAARDQGLVIKSYDPIHMVVAKLNQGDQPHLVKAREHYYRGNNDAAETELMAAIEKNPDSIAGHSHLLRIFAEKSNLVSARRHFNRVIELEPGNSTAYASWGLALGNTGRLAESVIAFQHAAELAPGDAQIKVALAGALARDGRHDEAIVQLDAALDIIPDHLNAQIMRGSALLALGQSEEALSALQSLQMPEKDIRTALVLRSISQAQQRLGQRDAALQSLSTAALVARQFNNPALAEAIERDMDNMRDAPPNE